MSTLVTLRSREQISCLPERATASLVVMSDEEWALLVAGLVATAVRVLDAHRLGRAGTCRESGGRWPCESACTAETNLALLRP